MVGQQGLTYRYLDNTEALVARMKRIEGQAQGIQRMLEEKRYCADILQQLSALTAATNEVALIMLQDHIKGCVVSAIKDGKGEAHISELMDVVKKAWK